MNTFNADQRADESITLARKLFTMCMDKDLMTGYVASVILHKLLRAEIRATLPLNNIDQHMDELEAGVDDVATEFIVGPK